MTKTYELSAPVRFVPGVGPRLAALLKNLGIITVEDLLRHYPARYEDFSSKKNIAELLLGEKVTIQGTLSKIDSVFLHSRRSITKGVFQDETGQLEIVWFNQPYLKKSLPVNTPLQISGEVAASGNKLTMINPVVELSQNPINTGGLIAIYPETRGLSSKWIRARLYYLLNLPKDQLKIDDQLPEDFQTVYQLLPLAAALKMIHLPGNFGEITVAKRRLAFEELLQLQLKNSLKKQGWEKSQSAVSIHSDKSQLDVIINKLPFKLTSAQNRALTEILADLGQNQPMNRLLQGDVGSGKTVVAALAAFTVFKAGFRTIIMAPTEILAKQHFQTLTELLEPHGIKTAIVTGETKRQPPTESGDVLVGTHALLHRKVPDKVGLVVIDEQHRFGVEQRGQLLKLTTDTKVPHLLTMTATPIPRTLALTFYGDLDLSIIDELPLGRRKVKTWVVPGAKREAAYAWIKTQLGQAFIVCPYIEASEVETLKSVKAAKSEFGVLAKIFSGHQLGLLHGRLKAAEKENVMNEFRAGKLDILVATPVVEVGVDIPTANLMVIEGANHFGLASLHQLRGRVGRGGEQAYCLLFSDSDETSESGRLKVLEKYSSGRKLAEMDLKWRGGGELFGTAQHGFTRLKIATLSDYDLIVETKKAAEEIIRDEGNHYPQLWRQVTAKNVNDVSPN